MIIEIDGAIHLHSENKEYDISRDIILNDFKIEILRFTNDEAISPNPLKATLAASVFISLIYSFSFTTLVSFFSNESDVHYPPLAGEVLRFKRNFKWGWT